MSYFDEQDGGADEFIGDSDADDESTVASIKGELEEEEIIE